MAPPPGGGPRFRLSALIADRQNIMGHFEITALDGEPGGSHAEVVGGHGICAGGQERAHARILIGADGGKELFIQRIHISGFGLRIGAGGQQQQRANA